MNQMVECELRNDGIHVTVYKYGDKIAANLIMIRIMLGDEIFAMDGGEKVFADEGELPTFAKEAILPCLTRVVERLTKSLSSMPIHSRVCDVAIGREPPKRFS